MRILVTALLITSTVGAAPQPAEIARKHLAAPGRVRAPLAELGQPEVFPAGKGWTARFRQTHLGVPVIGADVVMRIDAAGRVRRQNGTTFALGAVDVTPSLDAATAVEIARKHGARTIVNASDARAVLAIDPRAQGGPRLLWAVRPTPVPQILENALYLVDARSGQFLKRIDLLRYGKASVFLYNPVETPAPTTKDIPADFEPTNADGYLEGALLKAYDCLDEGEQKAVPGLPVGNVHICTVTPTAKSATYDYTGYQPAPEPWAKPYNGCPNAPLNPAATDADSGMAELQPLDAFSEQHMYWHVADAYTFFRGLFTDNQRANFTLRAKPLAIAVNLCTPDFSQGLAGNLTGPLVPFDNAFFSPGAGNIIAETLIMGQDSIMFGQGSKYDFAYDADVIRHEFTHAVIDTLGKLTAVGAEDVWGLQDDQGAMNEGLADYYSSVEVGDPTLGEYAGRNIPGSGAAEGAVRDLTNKDECGKNRWGEVHQDSQAFSASLWGARSAIAGDPKSSSFDAAKARLFDRAVLATIQGFASDVDMTTAATTVQDEVMMLIDPTAAQAVQDSFAAHKILPVCDRVIDYAAGDVKDVLGLDGTDSPYAPSGATKVPGFVQWKIDLPVGADSITATLTLSSQAGSFSGQGGFLGGGSAPSLELAVGPAGMPIQWVVGTSDGNEAASAPFSGTSGTVTATLSGLTVGTNYVMIFNSGGGIIAENIKFDTSCAGAAGCAPDMAVVKHPTGSGCSCELGAAGGFTLAPLFLVAFAFVLLRRRARG
jgi:hypothetical protein